MKAAVFAAILMLGACTTPDAPPLPIVPPMPCAPPTDLMRKAAGPQPVPQDVTTLREAVKLWVRDRADHRRTTDILTDLQSWVATKCQ